VNLYKVHTKNKQINKQTNKLSALYMRYHFLFIRPISVREISRS